MSGSQTAAQQVNGSALQRSTPIHGPKPNEGHDGASAPGSGIFHLSTSSRAQFSRLSASYPLKLLSPTPLPSQPRHVGIIYTLAYGGGLVAGDMISLQGRVDNGGGLVMLTQGSTKVFKHRPGIRPSSLRQRAPPRNLDASGSSPKDPVDLTRQRLHLTLEPGSFLLLLPDSVSPFRGSKYAQSQRFLLPHDGTASLLVLDWVNSGRGQRSSSALPSPTANGIGAKRDDGEIWSMDNYISTNEAFLGHRLVMREKLVLEASSESSTAARLAPYHVYATILILGPHLLPLLRHLTALCDKTRQYKISSPPGVLWSFSPLEGGDGGVLRVAAEEVEEARGWIKAALEAGGIKELVGEGLWPRII